MTCCLNVVLHRPTKFHPVGRQSYDVISVFTMAATAVQIYFWFCIWWRVITYMGKPSAVQSTNQANSAFHPFGVDKSSSKLIYGVCYLA